jgi:hypothetical protein
MPPGNAGFYHRRYPVMIIPILLQPVAVPGRMAASPWPAGDEIYGLHAAKAVAI